MSNHVHTFAGNPLDRAEAIRRDEAAITALANDAQALFLPFHELNVAVDNKQTLAWTKREDLSNFEQVIFLGIHNGAPRFAVDITVPEKFLTFTDCRSVATHLPVQETGILAQARSQLDWHHRNGFCAECGQPSRSERGGQVRRCSSCNKRIFPRTDAVAIMLIIDRTGGERCLLGQSRGFMAQTKFYSALAGFLDQGESLEDAVRREVYEEAGLRVGDVQYHSSQPWPFPSQLMMGCHGVAESQDITIDEVEMADVRWFRQAAVLDAVNKQNSDLRVPGELAIAHHLIRSWAEGEVVI